mmetsp:Transcript_14850/g.34904  ORF Transcript_14850/g.34904 Transcript_14850/m.34904 type:complete len:478 (+) Transcript_14850:1977-3410(+)
MRPPVHGQRGREPRHVQQLHLRCDGCKQLDRRLHLMARRLGSGPLSDLLQRPGLQVWPARRRLSRPLDPRPPSRRPSSSRLRVQQHAPLLVASVPDGSRHAVRRCWRLSRPRSSGRVVPTAEQDVGCRALLRRAHFRAVSRGRRAAVLRERVLPQVRALPRELHGPCACVPEYDLPHPLLPRLPALRVAVGPQQGWRLHGGRRTLRRGHCQCLARGARLARQASTSLHPPAHRGCGRGAVHGVPLAAGDAGGLHRGAAVHVPVHGRAAGAAEAGRGGALGVLCLLRAVPHDGDQHPASLGPRAPRRLARRVGHARLAPRLAPPPQHRPRHPRRPRRRHGSVGRASQRAVGRQPRRLHRHRRRVQRARRPRVPPRPRDPSQQSRPGLPRRWNGGLLWHRHHQAARRLCAGRRAQPHLRRLLLPHVLFARPRRQPLWAPPPPGLARRLHGRSRANHWQPEPQARGGSNSTVDPQHAHGG